MVNPHCRTPPYIHPIVSTMTSLLLDTVYKKHQCVVVLILDLLKGTSPKKYIFPIDSASSGFPIGKIYTPYSQTQVISLGSIILRRPSVPVYCMGDLRSMDQVRNLTILSSQPWGCNLSNLGDLT